MKWSLAFRLYIGSFVFHVHSYQDQFIQPGLLHVCLSLGNGIIVHYGYYGPLIFGTLPTPDVFDVERQYLHVARGQNRPR